MKIKGFKFLALSKSAIEQSAKIHSIKHFKFSNLGAFKFQLNLSLDI